MAEVSDRQRLCRKYGPVLMAYKEAAEYAETVGSVLSFVHAKYEPNPKQEGSFYVQMMVCVFFALGSRIRGGVLFSDPHEGYAGRRH